MLATSIPTILALKWTEFNLPVVGGNLLSREARLPLFSLWGHSTPALAACLRAPLATTFIDNEHPAAIKFLLLGNGDGTFGAPASFPVGNSPNAIQAADFNNDGKLDLVVANYTDGTVTLLLGNGDGTFTQPSGSPHAVGRGPSSLAAGNFNGDGKLDIAVANLLGRNGIDSLAAISSAGPHCTLPAIFSRGWASFSGPGRDSSLSLSAVSYRLSARDLKTA